MTLLPEPSNPRPSGWDRRPRINAPAFSRKLDRAKAPPGTLPQPRRRAILAAFCERDRLEAALAALPRLGVGVTRVGVSGTPAAFEALFDRRFRAAPIHGLGPFLVLDGVFAERAGSRPVVKALSRLPRGSGSDGFLVSDGWPLPLPTARADAAACWSRLRIFGAVDGPPGSLRPPAIFLGLRLSDAQPATTVCQALLAINDGPVELHDFRAL